MATDKPADQNTDPKPPNGGTSLARAEPQARPVRVVEHVQPLFDTAKFEQFQRAATALANSTLLSPSVRGDSPAQCFSNLILVFETAERWNMPGTALAQCISIVHGKLMFEGKVITAMLESTLKTRLHYHWTGKRGEPDYRIFVWDKSFDPRDGHITEEELAALAPDVYPRGARMIDGSVADWRTFQQNKTTPNPAWTGAATRNQLAYRGSREWARLYEPAQMLGVYGDDEIMAWEDRPASVPMPDGATSMVQTGFSKPRADDITDAEFTVADAGKPQEGQRAPAAPTTPAAVQSATGGQPGPKAARSKPPASPPAPAEPEEALHAGAADDEADQDALLEAAFNAGQSAAAAGDACDPPGDLSEDLQAEWVAGFHAHNSETAAEDEDGGDDSDFVGDGEVEEEASEEVEVNVVSLTEAREEGAKAFTECGPDVDPGTPAGYGPELTKAFLDGYTEAKRQATRTRAGRAPATDQAPPERDAFDGFQEGVRGLADWGAIKAGLGALGRSDAWKAASNSHEGRTRIRQARISAWLRQVELEDKGADAVDILADLTAFRCWCETEANPEIIRDNWGLMIETPLYTSLAAANRDSFAKAIRGVIAEREAS